ncbi:MAG: hypothetical protein NT013_00125, partial [Planctomycetia bacterium]|nr:hypothetical protein [Planctomycetia bacterium]
MSKSRVFTRKVEDISLVTRQGLSFAEAARRLEIPIFRTVSNASSHRASAASCLASVWRSRGQATQGFGGGWQFELAEDFRLTRRESRGADRAAQAVTVDQERV